MTTSDQMRRIEHLETASARTNLGPLVERIAAVSGITVGEIMAEADRILAATPDMTPGQRLDWLAHDSGTTVAELQAQSAHLLAAAGEDPGCHRSY